MHLSTFGDLRSLLHGAHTLEVQNERWDELLAILEAAHKATPEEVEEQWLPYVLVQLDTWEDEARMAPRSWVHMLLRQKSPGVLMALVRAVDVERIGNPKFKRMCEHDGFQWVTHLSFGGHKIRLDSIQELAESEVFTNLTSLVFHDTNLGSVKLHALSRAPFIENLKSLRLPSCELGSNELEVLFKKFALGELRQLDLRDNPLDDNGAVAMCNADLPALRHLTLSSQTPLEVIERCLAPSEWSAQLERLTLILYQNRGRMKPEDIGSRSAVRRWLREHSGVFAKRMIPPYKELLEQCFRTSSIREEVWRETLENLG